MKKRAIILLLLIVFVGICGCGGSGNGKVTSQEDNIRGEIDKTTDNGIVYRKNSQGSITIKGYTGNESEIVIPEVIDGLSVTEIGGEAFYQNKNITSVTLPKTLEVVGMNSFFGCSSLVSLTLPENLEGIWEGAFSYCTSLPSITLPKTLTQIGYMAFSNCKSLKHIEIPASVNVWGDDSFIDSGLESVELENGLALIGNRAFCPKVSHIWERRFLPSAAR